MAIWRSCLLAGVALALVAAANADTHHASPGNFEVEQSDIFCKEYENSNEATLDVEESPSVRSGMRVFDRFDVTDVKVSFNLTYTRMGALNIALQLLHPIHIASPRLSIPSIRMLRARSSRGPVIL